MQSITDSCSHIHSSPECNTSSQLQKRWTFLPEEGDFGLWTLPGVMQKESEWGHSTCQVWGGAGK